MATLRSQPTHSALDQERLVLVHVEAKGEDFAGSDIEAAFRQFSTQSVATLRTSRHEMTLGFCCMADAVAYALDCLRSAFGASIRLGVYAQSYDHAFRLQTWDLMSAQAVVKEATFGGLAMCRDAYSVASEFFQGSDWFVALYEGASDEIDIAVISRMPLAGTQAFSTFAGLSPAAA